VGVQARAVRVDEPPEGVLLTAASGVEQLTFVYRDAQGHER
jgi:hypothetical protein